MILATPSNALTPKDITSHSPSESTTAKDQAVRVPGLQQSIVPNLGRASAMKLFGPQKIVGGTDTSISTAPWQVALLNLSETNDYDAQFCAGSIIADNWILTAAHCVENVDPSDIAILSGVDFLDNTQFTETDMTYVDEIVMNADYESVYFTNDIALIRLTEPLTLESDVRETIALPTASPSVGTYLQITGWGSIDSFGDAYPQQLQTSRQRVVSTINCTNAFDGFDSATQICVGVAPFDSIAACSGDSGGPAAVISGGVATLAGLTSYGSAAGCIEGYPDVFTKIYGFLSWIDANMVDPVDPVEGTLHYAWIETEFDTVYPKVDGYRDTIEIYAHVVSTMGEGYVEDLGTGSKLVIKKGTTVVKTWNLTSSGDTYFTWNGLKSGAISQGYYTISVVAYGLDGDPVTSETTVGVSKKKLVTKSWSKTRSGKLFTNYISYDDTACQFYGSKLRVWTFGYGAHCYGELVLPAAIQTEYANPTLNVKLTVSKSNGDYCAEFTVLESEGGWRAVCRKKTYSWNMGSLDASNGVLTADIYGYGDYSYTSIYVSKVKFTIKYKALK